MKGSRVLNELLANQQCLYAIESVTTEGITGKPPLLQAENLLLEVFTIAIGVPYIRSEHRGRIKLRMGRSDSRDLNSIHAYARRSLSEISRFQASSSR